MYVYNNFTQEGGTMELLGLEELDDLHKGRTHQALEKLHPFIQIPDSLNRKHRVGPFQYLPRRSKFNARSAGFRNPQQSHSCCCKALSRTGSNM